MKNFYGFKPFPYNNNKPVDYNQFLRFLHPLNFSSKFDTNNITTLNFYKSNKFWFFLPPQKSPGVFLWYLMCDSKDSFLYKNKYEEVIATIIDKIAFLDQARILIKNKNIPNLDRALNNVKNTVFSVDSGELSYNKNEFFELPHKFGFWLSDCIDIDNDGIVTKDNFLNPTHPFEEDPSFNINAEQFFNPKYNSLFHDKESILDPLGDLIIEFCWDILSNSKEAVDSQTYNMNLELLNPVYFKISIKGIINLTSKFSNLSDNQRAIITRALMKYRVKYKTLKERIDKFFL